MMKIYIYTLISFLCFSCSLTKENSKHNQVVRIEIYQINQFKTFITSLNCNDVKKRFEKEIIFVDKKDLKEFNEFIFNIKKIDTVSNVPIDPRVSITYYNEENYLINQFCWSMSGFSLNGVFYKKSDYVNHFLKDKKIIIEVVD